ncbi:MAG: helix-turn-helix transcriptional regulator [Candidatus Azobacteroides sp.]|nr:helix-turn-helix transcriptional regulator [Candidatus Azobacteroides sp.]
MKLRIKEICRERGIMLKDVAKQLSITEVGLSKSLNGNPPLNRLKDIADALNVPITELFEQPATDFINCPYCGNRIKVAKE